MKKSWIFMLLLIMIISFTVRGKAESAQNSCSVSDDYSSEEMEIIALLGEDRFIREGIACDAYDRMLAAFSSDLLTDGADYPSFYGGAYIDERGDLVINVTENSSSILDMLSSVTGLSEVQVKLVPYSYAELIKMSQELQEQISLADECLKGKISGFGIDQEKCLVRVYTKGTKPEDEDAIRELASDPNAIIIIGSCGFATEETEVKAGSALSDASVAYRAKTYYNGEYVIGIMTAAHAVALNNYIYTSDGVAFAKCIKRGYGGTMDSAFCMITNYNYVPSNYIDSDTFESALLSTSTSNPPQNATVYKRGKNTGLTYGTVTETAGTYNFNNIVWSNLTFASYSSTGGDSGGIVFRISSGVRYTVGIHRGRWNVDGENVAVYVKASVQNYVLEATRY